MFIYNPMMDYQSNVLLRGPYNGQSVTSPQIGTPAGQFNGQQPGGYGQQNPSQLTPGTQFPPDQTQPH